MKNDSTFVILGASDNPMRPSHLAEKLLSNKGFKTYNIPHGDIQQSMFSSISADTISIFLKPAQQKKYYEFMMALKPSRIIFNPGTENAELTEMALKNNIKVLTGCTIAMLMNKLL